jgi:hypothetical protein
MALSISGNLVIDEEFRVPSTGSVDNEVSTLSADPTLLAYLNGLNSAPDTGFRQYAERDDMIVGFANGATLSLVADSSGTPFSTTVGIATGFTDIDGDAISLYQADASHPNVIVGKDAGGEVSFAIVLDGVKVYIVQFQPLFHTTAGAVDSADFHDLTGLIFVQAASTVTTTLNFSDFTDVPSGQDEFAMIAPDTAPPGQQGAVQFLVTGVSNTGAHSTVNVSTQGGFNGSLGTGSQATGVNESLIFDLVTGGDVTISNTEAHDAANIDFANHVTGFREAGFGIVQTNPNNASVDVLLTAYNVKTASDTTDGAAFITASLDPTKQDKVTITSVTIIQTDGTTNTYTVDTPNIVDFRPDGSVIINNLKDDWLVEFTTSSDLDRFAIKNAGTGNEQFDIGRLSATSSSTQTVKEFADLGAHLIYEDDGPIAALAINANTFVTVDESLFQNPGEDETGSLGAVTVTGAVLFSLAGTDAGADQLKPNSTTFALALGSGNGTDSGLDDTATGQNIVLVKVNDHLVEGHVGTTVGALALSVAITDAGNVTLTQYRAVVHNDPDDPDEPGASAATFSAGALTATATVVDKDNDPDASNAVDLGLVLRLEDDGPSISTPANSIVDFAENATSGDKTISDSFGSDGAGLVTVIAPTGWVYNADHTSATLSNTDGLLFRITVDNDSYKFDVLQDAPLTFNPLNFAAIPSGGPQETLTVLTTDPNDTTSVTFNGLLFVNTANPLDPANNPGNASANDDLNPDAVGFGVKNGQASQMNNNDGFFAQDAAWTNADSGTNNHEINGLRFDVQGIGGVKTAHMEYWFVDDGVVVGGPHFQDLTNIPSGNNVLADVTIHSDTSFDQVYVRFFFDGPNVDNKGIRLENFEIQTPNPVPDQTFAFGLNITDKDLDHATTTTNFLVGWTGITTVRCQASSCEASMTGPDPQGAGPGRFLRGNRSLQARVAINKTEFWGDGCVPCHQTRTMRTSGRAQILPISIHGRSSDERHGQCSHADWIVLHAAGVRPGSSEPQRADPGRPGDPRGRAIRVSGRCRHYPHPAHDADRQLHRRGAQWAGISGGVADFGRGLGQWLLAQP